MLAVATLHLVSLIHSSLQYVLSNGCHLNLNRVTKNC